jgi:hypothetical protein
MQCGAGEFSYWKASRMSLHSTVHSSLTAKLLARNKKAQLRIIKAYRIF